MSASRRRPGHRARAGGRWLAAAAVVVLVTGGCGPTPASDALAASPSVAAVPPLVVLGLAGVTSPIGVVSVDAVRPVTAPPGEIQSIASDARGSLVATLTDGTVLRTGGSLGGDARWQAVPRPSTVPADPALSFGVPEPSGDRVVALSAAYGSGDRSTLVVLGPSGSGRVIPLPVQADGATPAWVDAGRVIVTGIGAGELPRSAVVDVATGQVSKGPDGIRSVAVSTAGGRAAVVGTDGRTIRVVPLAALVGAGGPGASRGSTSPPGAQPSPADQPAIGPPDGVGIATALALDATGRWLAVVWTDADLVPSVVATYVDDAGWREASRSALGGHPARAGVAWL